MRVQVPETTRNRVRQLAGHANDHLTVTSVPYLGRINLDLVPVCRSDTTALASGHGVSVARCPVLEFHS